MLIEDGFVKYLLDIIEGLSDDVNDPYHYPVIKVLVLIPSFSNSRELGCNTNVPRQLILNEQYMLLAHDPGPDQPTSTYLTNKVIKILSLHGSVYKTFSENLILLLNRESIASLNKSPPLFPIP